MARETLADLIGQKDAIGLVSSIIAARAVARLEREFLTVDPSDGQELLRKSTCRWLKKMADGLAKGTYSAVADLNKVDRNIARRRARRKGGK